MMKMDHNSEAIYKIEYNFKNTYKRENTEFSTLFHHVNACYMCRLVFDKDNYQAHMEKHAMAKTIKLNGLGFKLSLKNLRISAKFMDSNSVVNVTIENSSKRDTNIIFVYLFNSLHKHQASFDDKVLPKWIATNEKINMQIKVDEIKDFASNKIVIFYVIGQSEYVEQYDVKITTSNNIMKEGVQPPVNKIKFEPLNDYTVSSEMKQLTKKKFKKTVEMTNKELILLEQIEKMKTNDFLFEPDNYAECLSILVEMEDYQSKLDMCQYDKRNRHLRPIQGKQNYYQLLENESKPIFLKNGDNIAIQPSRGGGRGNTKQNLVFGTVVINNKGIYYKLGSKINENEAYNIHFTLNRITFRLEREALKQAKEKKLQKWLFPDSTQLGNSSAPPIKDLNFKNTDIKKDVHQVQAVNCIVAGTAYPLPYLLVGVPGGGKTNVLVESIYQIWKNVPESKVLVCAPSNSVCNEIASRLLKFIDYNNKSLYRLYGTSLDPSKFDLNLENNSNLKDRSYPSLLEIYNYRIVVTTLAISGRLAKALSERKHFTHLFIDECQSATEPLTIMPITGLCSEENRVNVHVILAGDEKQLGPVIKSQLAKGIGLGVSLFERLLERNVYKPNEKTKLYNPNIVGYLCNNYRCHPSIVDICNTLFYDNQMTSCYDIDKLNCTSNIQFLPNKNFPIFFESAHGAAERLDNNRSYFNDVEADQVLLYVKELLKIEVIKQSHIGIITPYKQQCINIEEKCKANNFQNIEVGTVEQFQGKEKHIVIISTVRSSFKKRSSIGFVECPKRLNVMLTRAKSVVIMIGNEINFKNATQQWEALITYIENNDGFIN